MTDFERAISIIVDIEKGYVNDPNDPGGETKYGIAKRFWPNVDIKNLSLDGARKIYKENYWDPCQCDSLPWPLNLFVFDCAVNQGIDAAIRTLQKSLGVAQDGVIGRVTIEAAKRADKEATARLMVFRAMRYIGTRNFDRYGDGWFKRLFLVAMGAGHGVN